MGGGKEGGASDGASSNNSRTRPSLPSSLGQNATRVRHVSESPERQFTRSFPTRRRCPTSCDQLHRWRTRPSPGPSISPSGVHVGATTQTPCSIACKQHATYLRTVSTSFYPTCITPMMSPSSLTPGPSAAITSCRDDDTQKASAMYLQHVRKCDRQELEVLAYPAIMIEPPRGVIGPIHLNLFARFVVHSAPVKADI